MKVEQSTAAQFATGPQSPARRLSEALLLAYLCLLPVHWSPLPFNLQWADAIFPFLLAAALLSRPAFRLTRVDLLVAGYLLAALPSFLVTVDVRASAVQFAKDVYMAALFFVVAMVASRGDLMARVGRVVAWTGTLVALLSLIALALFYGAGVALPRIGYALPVPYVGEFYRLYGTFPSPEYFVNFLIFSAPFAFMWWRRGRSGRPVTGWALALAAMLGAAVGAVAHGIVGLIAALTYQLAGMWRNASLDRDVGVDRTVDRTARGTVTGRHRAVTALLVTATVILTIAANVLLVFAVRDVRVVKSRDTSVGAPAYTHALHDAAGAPKVSVEVTYDLMAYGLLKQVAWEAFLAHPLAGGGLGSLHQATRRAEAEGRLPQGHGDDDPHSTWFGRLGETGVIGTAALVGLCAGMWMLARRARAAGGDARALAVPFAAGLIGILVNSLNVDAMHFRFVWIALGALRALAPAA